MVAASIFNNYLGQEVVYSVMKDVRAHIVAYHRACYYVTPLFLCFLLVCSF
jgi:hypothetical protein